MTKTGRLDVTTPSDREIRMVRAFDAPRELVWDAWTRPELVRRWLLGPDGWSMAVCEMDVRPGGAYRWVWRRDADGTVMGMGGVYREVERPERLVASERFDDAWYEGECLVTTTLVEAAGRTTVTTDTIYDSREIRDGVLKSGMETGVERSYERLEEMLPELVTAARR